jgi:hypothetical protein
MCTVALALGTAACERQTDAMTPDRAAQTSGLTGYSASLPMSDGSINGRVVPVTLEDGRQAHLIIPSQRTVTSETVYLREQDAVRPVRVSRAASRTNAAPARAVARRTVAPAKKTRSWQKEALIIGGSAGAGTLIGSLTGGGKGAAIGAAAGGIGGLVYDLTTRDK